jgi:glycine/D-amino acid oxidase-like deaminating enzyme
MIASSGSLPIKNEQGQREVPTRADVIVVGGGIMGASVAYWLGKVGADALVLEKGIIGHGVSSWNAGIVAKGPAQEYMDCVELIGRDSARELMSLAITNQVLLDDVVDCENLECGYVRRPFLALAGSKDSLHLVTQSVSMMRDDGFDVRLLSRKECEQALGTALGRKIQGGAVTPDDRAVTPSSYHRAVLAAAARVGAVILENTAVLSLDGASTGWKVKTIGSTFRAEHVILAVNDCIPNFLPSLEGLFDTEIHRVEVTKPVDVPLHATWAVNEHSLYGRQDSTGAILFGGPVRRPKKPNIRPRRIETLGQLMPDFAGLSVAAQWEAPIVNTPDFNPLVGRWPLCPNLWLLAGFGGHALPFSMVLSRLLAQEVLGLKGSCIPSSLRPDRFLR